LTTVADAYLKDPTIADRVVVLMTDIAGAYNVKRRSTWSTYIVAERMRLADRSLNPPLGEPSMAEFFPASNFTGLPDDDLTKYIRNQPSVRPPITVGDGAGLFLFFRPGTWTGVAKKTVTGVWSYRDGSDSDYDFLQLSGWDVPLMRDEFFETLRAFYANRQGAPPMDGGGGGGNGSGGSGGQGALQYAVYEGDWNALPDFTGMTPVRTGTTSQLDVSVRTRDDQFGIVFWGYLVIPETGDWTFYLKSDDGSRLWIDGQLLVDNDGLHATQERSGTRSLTAGAHSFRVEYFEKGGEQFLEVGWVTPGGVRQTIPANALSTQDPGSGGGGSSGGSGSDGGSGGGDGGTAAAGRDRDGREGCSAQIVAVPLAFPYLVGLGLAAVILCDPRRVGTRARR
jgi:uncharacterized membrane protein YgcG